LSLACGSATRPPGFSPVACLAIACRAAFREDIDSAIKPGNATARQSEQYDQAAQVFEAEACEPARRALDRFRQVPPHLARAANFQASSQAEIREATDMQVCRQQAILEKPACR
jgi:hypothetical protein